MDDRGRPYERFQIEYRRGDESTVIAFGTKHLFPLLREYTSLGARGELVIVDRESQTDMVRWAVNRESDEQPAVP